MRASSALSSRALGVVAGRAQRAQRVRAGACWSGLRASASSTRSGGVAARRAACARARARAARNSSCVRRAAPGSSARRGAPSSQCRKSRTPGLRSSPRPAPRRPARDLQVALCTIAAEVVDGVEETSSSRATSGSTSRGTARSTMNIGACRRCLSDALEHALADDRQRARGARDDDVELAQPRRAARSA